MSKRIKQHYHYLFDSYGELSIVQFNWVDASLTWVEIATPMLHKHGDTDTHTHVGNS